jgi:transposase-like protein
MQRRAQGATLSELARSYDVSENTIFPADRQHIAQRAPIFGFGLAEL